MTDRTSPRRRHAGAQRLFLLGAALAFLGGCQPGSEQLRDAGRDSGSCLPACAHRSCGDDGCGGTCGSCSTLQRCDDGSGQCVAAPCAGRQCGPDGDGGSCGACGGGAFCSADAQCLVGKLDWAGLRWNVRAGGGGPGPNTWDRANVGVDDAGSLHLQIARRDGGWTTAEISSELRFAPGDFRWFVEAPLDRLDPSVVLGLFTYPTSDVGPDGTNELDIEITRWGNAAVDPVHYTVFPAPVGRSPSGTTLPMTLTGTYTTHVLSWRPDAIHFESHGGFRTDAPSTFASWTFAPPDAGAVLPQSAEPVHLNLWLYRGVPPADDAGVEVIIHDFAYTAP